METINVIEVACKTILEPHVNVGYFNSNCIEYLFIIKFYLIKGVQCIIFLCQFIICSAICVHCIKVSLNIQNYQETCEIKYYIIVHYWVLYHRRSL